MHHSIKELFPDVDIRKDYKHPLLMFSESKKEMELDIFLPELKLAFEYQVFTFLFSFASRSLIEFMDRVNNTTCGTLCMVRQHRNRNETQKKGLLVRKMESP